MISMFTVNFAFLVSAACGQVSSDMDQGLQRDALQRVFCLLYTSPSPRD